MFKKTALMSDYTYFSTQITWSVVYSLIFMFTFGHVMNSFLPENAPIVVKVMLFNSLMIFTGLYLHMGYKELKSWTNSHIFPVIAVMISSFIISLKLFKFLKWIL